MTGALQVAPDEGGSRSFADATPAQLRGVLTPEAAGEFDRQWRAVMARATESLDLSEVFQVLAGWREVARLTAHLGHEGYRAFEAKIRDRGAPRPVAGEKDPGSRAGRAEADALIRARLSQSR